MLSNHHDIEEFSITPEARALHATFVVPKNAQKTPGIVAG